VTARYSTNASTTRSTPRTIWRRRSVPIQFRPEVRGKLERQGERPGRVVLRQRHVVDNHERGRRFELVDESPDAVVVALEHHADVQPADPLVLHRLDRGVA